jgi:hypothetical protein
VTQVELRAAEAAGADLPTAGDLRIVLTGDELVGRGAEREIRVRVADVRSLAWLDQARTRALLPRGNGPLAFIRDLLGLVVVIGDEGPLLAFYVHDVATVTAADALAHLRSSGVEELAGALGVPVEGSNRATLDRAAVSSVLVGHRRWHVRTLLATPLVWLAGAAGFAAGPGAEEWWGTAGLVLGLVLATVVTSWLVVAQRALRAAVSRAPDLEDRVRFPATDDPSPLASQLQLGGDQVVVWSGWRLSRRRGPLRRGGITRCLVGPTLTSFLDDRGGAQLVFETSELVPDEASLSALADACGAVGIGLERGEDDGAAVTLRRQTWTFDRAARPEHDLHPVEHAGVSTLAPVLLPVALVAEALGAIALAAEGSPVGWLGLATLAALTLAFTWCRLSLRGLRGRTTRANPRHVPAPRLDWWRSRIGGPGGARIVHRPTTQERA